MLQTQKDMNTFSLIQLVGAVGKERFLIQSMVLQYGINSLFENYDSIEISNKTKIAIKQLDNILYGKGNIIESISGLTEIPVKVLLTNQKVRGDILTIKDHPEKLDIDTRQFYRLRCLNDVAKDFEEEQNQQKTEYLKEQGYEQEEV